MKCTKATRLLQAYLDDELSAAQEKRLEHHLKGCAMCRLELAAHKRTGEAMDSWKGVEPRRDLVSSVMDVIRYEQEAPSRFAAFVEMLNENRRKILAVGANLMIFLALVLKIPSFLTVNNLPIQSGMQPPALERPSETEHSFDPVDTTAYINELMDGQNLSPMEKDVIYENLMENANGFVYQNTSAIPTPTSSENLHAVRMIIRVNTDDGSVHAGVILLQSNNDEKEEE